MEDRRGKELLDQVADCYGIDAEYHDIYGRHHVIGTDTKRMLLEAMGVPTDSSEALAAVLQRRRDRAWTEPCDPVLVRRIGAIGNWSFRMPVVEAEEQRTEVEWAIDEEEGRCRTTGHAGPGIQAEQVESVQGRRYVRFDLPLPADLDLGYYRLTAAAVSPSHRIGAALRLIVVPARCYRPEAFEQGKRLWGLALQLYALRSDENWGVGDFGDLQGWVEWAATDLKAHVIGLNPLHVLRNSRPYHISPYSPDSRLYVNPLYVAIPRIPEYRECATAQRLFQDPDTHAKLESLKKSETVEYDDVIAIKRTVLHLLFDTFRTRHFRSKGQTLHPCTERGRAFERFVKDEGESLERFALFQALSERLRERDGSIHVWQEWPDRYRDPTSPACRSFLRRHGLSVRFHQYVQWVAHEQLSAVARRAQGLGMPIGLYHDLALGSDRGGSDAWVFQSVLALSADAGCPPDAFAPDGQNWGLPPVDPHRLRDQGYQMFIDLIRHNLRYGGAVRLDHVMALFRLFWIPRGMKGSAGAYVRYPWEDLLGILALESVRCRAVIVGEDLGTVPDFVREKLSAAGVLSYRVFYFERRQDAEWKAPGDYPRSALAVVTTHDLPTLMGFWSGEDIAIRARLGLYPHDDAHRAAVEERKGDKMRMLRALRDAGLLPPDAEDLALMNGPLSPRLAEAIHVYVARTPSFLMLASLEDLLGQETQINVPGTFDAYPNWSHKSSMTLQEARMNAWAAGLASALQHVRP